MTLQTEFESYIREHLNQLYRFAYTYVMNQTDAEDVVGESIIKALNALHTLKNQEYMGTWFYRIMINTAINMKKNKARTVPTDFSDGDWLNVKAPDHEDESHLWFWDIINTLGPEQKSVFVLRYLEEKTLNEVAVILGLPTSTVKTRLYRGLKQLRREMEESNESR